MTKPSQAPKEVIKSTPHSLKEKRVRKEQVLAQGMPSVTRSIADAVVIKNGDIFFLSEPDGDVPLGCDHGFGLYYHDCRFLNGYQFRLSDSVPNVLAATAAKGSSAVFELTNRELKIAEGEHIPMGEIGVTWERTLDGDRILLKDWIHLKNYGQNYLEFPIAITFDAEFEDVFAVRGLFTEHLGTHYPPDWKDGKLFFLYEGADGLFRGLTVHFTPQPQKTDGAHVEFIIRLAPNASQEIQITLVVSETQEKDKLRLDLDDRKITAYPANTKAVPADWLTGQTEFHSDSYLLNQIIDRSLRDLNSLRTSIHGEYFFAAGVPWFVTLFGRDSLITALQTLSINPEIAAETLRLLAGYQAQKVDKWRDAQPGKILHEVRIGEFAHLDKIPHTPYYGTVDATPLFLILLASHANWTGDLALFDELRGAVDLALEWIDRYGDSDGDGYVEYKSASRQGLINQGWKDSGNAIVDSDGRLAQPPISLVEVQGYVYAAKTGLAGLFDRAGEKDRAARLVREAEALRSRFNRDFWSEDLGTYALALEAQGEQVAVVSSNPGHALWSGIADQEKARRTAERLMAEDMFNGWGIRTLSSKERRYNPIGYHLGTVWPHDNALIAAGFRRYGFDEAAGRIISGILEAAIYFEEFRLPELFAGFSRSRLAAPVHFPVACHPQAWAAGSVPYLLCTLLGLEPAAFDGQLRIRRPMLPQFVETVQVRKLRVGRSMVDLDYQRTRDMGVVVNVVNIDGALDVILEPDSFNRVGLD